MILVVDSGATKADWLSGAVNLKTKGINAALMSARDIEPIVAEAAEFFAGKNVQVSEVFFYAAGVAVPEFLPADGRGRTCHTALGQVLSRFFPEADIRVQSDLMAASRALWGDGAGVVAILGTGSNSCLYSSGEILKNVCPGGFILGDEGGGVSFGRALISDYIKNLLPGDLKSEFEKEFEGIGYSGIVENVYKSANPSGYLASFAPFLLSRLATSSYAGKVVGESLAAFVERSLMQYRDSGGGRIKVGVVGSIGLICKDLLTEIGESRGVDFVKFIASPGPDLLNYHENCNFAADFSRLRGDV